MVTTRFAPSPTGDLHLGGAWTALASWALARAVGGRVALRVEDIDTPRVVRGSAERILDDLLRLGLDWDGAVVRQSARTALYEAAIAKLDVYPCDCSRAEIARAASAPHEKEAVYPGTCRNAPSDREFKRSPALRLRVPKGARVVFDDAVRGTIEEDVSESAGDFVLRRGDGVFAYQLVVAVDDAAMGVSHVVRADDLLDSTARQILLLRLLGHDAIPTYAHVPLVVAPDGQRLAKRTRGAIVRDLAAPPAEIIGTLARGLGLTHRPGPMTPNDVAAALAPPSTWRKEPWSIPEEWT